MLRAQEHSAGVPSSSCSAWRKRECSEFRPCDAGVDSQVFFLRCDNHDVDFSSDTASKDSLPPWSRALCRLLVDAHFGSSRPINT